LRIAAEVSVFGKAASEIGSEASFSDVLRGVALFSRELVTSTGEWGMGNGKTEKKILPPLPIPHFLDSEVAFMWRCDALKQ